MLTQALSQNPQTHRPPPTYTALILGNDITLLVCGSSAVCYDIWSVLLRIK